MKSSLYFRHLICLLAFVAASMAAACGAPTQQKVKTGTSLTSSNAVPKSVFNVPSNFSEGRDPFFPNRLAGGTRTIITAPAASHANVQLVLNGLSGTQDHRLAMINGRTVAENEVVEVSTPAGRVAVRCIQIKGQTVLVEVAGERRELHLRD